MKVILIALLLGFVVCGCDIWYPFRLCNPEVNAVIVEFGRAGDAQRQVEAEEARLIVPGMGSADLPFPGPYNKFVIIFADGQRNEFSPLAMRRFTGSLHAPRYWLIDRGALYMIDRRYKDTWSDHCDEIRAQAGDAMEPRSRTIQSPD